MIYKIGDILDTNKGLYFVQCSIPFKGRLQGTILYWLQDENGEDLLLWDDYLKDILISQIKYDCSDGVYYEEF